MSPDEARLYDLIWKRTVASQMADARGQSVQVRLGGTVDGRPTTPSSAPAGKVIEFPGFLRAYVEGSDDPDAELEDREVHLPPLAAGDALDLAGLERQGPRDPAAGALHRGVAGEAARGAGRRPPVDVRVDHRHHPGPRLRVEEGHRARALVHRVRGRGAARAHFGDLVDYAFTARMEDDLDGIASGEQEAVPWLTRFYFGNGQVGLHAVVDRTPRRDRRARGQLDPDRSATTRTARSSCASGSSGPTSSAARIARRVPEDIAPDELTVEKATELLDAPSGDRVLGDDPESGLRGARRAPAGSVPTCSSGEAEPDGDKPRTASLFKTMSLDTVTLDDALRLLSLPRVARHRPGRRRARSTAQNGRYGPYVKKGAETRSLDDEEQLFSVTLDEALRLLAEPKAQTQNSGMNIADKPRLYAGFHRVLRPGECWRSRSRWRDRCSHPSSR